MLCLEINKSIGGGEFWIVETSSSEWLTSGSHSFSTWKHEQLKRKGERKEERAKSQEGREEEPNCVKTNSMNLDMREKRTL